MGNGEDDDGSVENKVRDEVRESTDRYPSYFEVFGDILYQCCSLRPTRDRLNGPIECSEKGKPESLPSIFVPKNCIIDFFDRLIDEADCGRHLSRMSTARWRTIFQS